MRTPSFSLGGSLESAECFTESTPYDRILSLCVNLKTNEITAGPDSLPELRSLDTLTWSECSERRCWRPPTLFMDHCSQPKSLKMAF
jgi:hypothetical protein